MALIMFRSSAAAPFIMFEETAQEIFKKIGQTWTPEGGFSADQLSEIIKALDRVILKEKEAEKQAREAEELKIKQSTYDEELRYQEEKSLQSISSKIYLYQRIQPLREMMSRALHHQKPVMWGKPY